MQLRDILTVRNHLGYKVLVVFGFKIRLFKLNMKKRNLEQNLNSLYRIMNNFCDPTLCKKASGNLRLIQVVKAKCLHLVTLILEKNNLNYWLDFGTLIGAVRHKGFIPWDDDIDITMFHDEYFKAFDVLCKELAGTDFTPKIGTEGRSSIIRIHGKGIIPHYVDIFPYDVSNANLTKEDLIKKASLLKNKLFKKFEIISSDEMDVESLYYKEVVPEYKKEGIQVEDNAPNLIFRGIDSLYNADGFDIHNIANLLPLTKHEWEGYNMLVPAKPIEFLSEIEYYGDVMKFPPPESLYFHYSEEQLIDKELEHSLLEIESSLDDLIKRYEN